MITQDNWEIRVHFSFVLEVMKFMSSCKAAAIHVTHFMHLKNIYIIPQL